MNPISLPNNDPYLSATCIPTDLARRSTTLPVTTSPLPLSLEYAHIRQLSVDTNMLLRSHPAVRSLHRPCRSCVQPPLLLSHPCLFRSFLCVSPPSAHFGPAFSLVLHVSRNASRLLYGCSTCPAPLSHRRRATLFCSIHSPLVSSSRANACRRARISSQYNSPSS